MSAVENLAFACCGRWAADRSRFALYCAGESGDSAWTFWDIQREANRFSNVLGAVGVMRGERVALLLPQRAETAALHIACYQMGAVAVPLSPRLGGDALAEALAAADVRVAVVDGAGQEALARLPAKAALPKHAIGVGSARAAWLREWSALRPLASTRYTPLDQVDGLAALLLDAGTDAAVAVAHGDLGQHAEAFLAAHPGYPQPGDLFWSPADWDSPAGLLEGLLPAWSRGQPVVACESPFDPESACDLISKYDVRNVRLTPRELEAMMAAVPKPNDKYDCRLRTVATGAAAPSSQVSAWLEAELGIVGAAGRA